MGRADRTRFQSRCAMTTGLRSGRLLRDFLALSLWTHSSSCGLHSVCGTAGCLDQRPLGRFQEEKQDDVAGTRRDHSKDAVASER